MDCYEWSDCYDCFIWNVSNKITKFINNLLAFYYDHRIDDSCRRYIYIYKEKIWYDCQWDNSP